VSTNVASYETRDLGHGAHSPLPETRPLRVTWVYDMDACRAPTGVTRHALAQRSELAGRDDVRLSALTGRISEPDGRREWAGWGALPRRAFPVRTRTMLRLWRVLGAPAVEWFGGPADWVYCPAEFYLPTRRARLAVTSHDVLQDLTHGGPRRRVLLAKIVSRADLVCSVSHFNTRTLIEAFPACRDRTAYVPNAADDLFFESPDEAEVAAAWSDLGLPRPMPYLLSVANFQPRKNLERLVRAVGRLPEVARGELGLVLVGEGAPEPTRRLEEVIAGLPGRAVVARPGYRQGAALRAAYAGALALVFASTCESFGIPAVEAMAQGCPVALADSTALPEVAGDAAWYFDPTDVDAITATLRDLIDQPAERARRTQIGRLRASDYRWARSCDRLVEALRARS
jgi:glycosyltransferase involved in cell wall biosynthesis